LKLILFLLFAPVALLLLLILVIAGIVGVPLLWEQVQAKLQGPSGPGQATT